VITVVDYGFGPGAHNRIDEIAEPGIAGAVAALETYYYALNRADMPVLAALWSGHDLAQLDDPVGGTERSPAAIADLYRHLFCGAVNVQVTFTDAVTYDLGDAVVFAGRERGTYRRNDGRRVALDVRTSRLFGWDDARRRWAQLHHHGSIDDPFALADYQATARR
jgi:hypothetical protein